MKSRSSGAGFESRQTTAGLRCRSACRLGSNPVGRTKNAGDDKTSNTTCSFFLVRPAGFEPAAYGFEDDSKRIVFYIFS